MSARVCTAWLGAWLILTTLLCPCLAADILEQQREVSALCFSPSGELLAAGDSTSTIRTWDVRAGKLTGSWKASGSSVWHLATSPDGSLLASGEENGHVLIFDWQDGTLRKDLGDWGEGISALAFSPDCSRLAVAAAPGKVNVIDLSTGSVRATLTTGQAGDQVRELRFRGNRSTLVGAGDSGLVYTWDTDHGQRVASREPAARAAVGLSWDGRLAAYASSDMDIRVLDIASGDTKCRVAGHRSYTIKNGVLAFSPDGKKLAAMGLHEVTIFDLGSASVQCRVGTENLMATDFAFSPDGRMLAANGTPGADFGIWSATSGNPTATFLALPRDLIMAAIAAARGNALPALAQIPIYDEYLIWTREGYYTGSASADRFVRFAVGTSLFAAECFQNRYYRPDLVAAALAGQPVPQARLTGPYPPRVTILSPQEGAEVIGDQLQVSLRAQDDSRVKELIFFVNGARCLAVAPRWSAQAPDQCTLTIPLPPVTPHVRLQVMAIDDDNLQSERAVLSLTHRVVEPTARRVLALCVGIASYGDTLRYCDDDALAVAERMRSQTGARYAKAEVKLLTNERAGRGPILSALNDLVGAARRTDTVVIHLSGHGMASGRKFYFVPHGADTSDPDTTCVPWDEVVARLVTLSERSAKTVVLIDACQSGAVDVNGLAKAIFLSRAGTLVYTSSRANEKSWEAIYPLAIGAEGHGAFTGAILEALWGWTKVAADSLSVSELLQYVGPRVEELTAERQHPYAPPSLLLDFDVTEPLFTVPARSKPQSRPRTPSEGARVRESAQQFAQPGSGRS